MWWVLILLSVVVSVHDGTVVYLEWKRVVIICQSQHVTLSSEAGRQGRFSPVGAGDWWKHQVNLNARAGWGLGQCSFAGRES